MGHKMDEAKGRAKQAAGDLTGNERLRNEGRLDRAAATVKEQATKARDRLGGAVDTLRDKAARALETGRDAKDRAKDRGGR